MNRRWSNVAQLLSPENEDNIGSLLANFEEASKKLNEKKSKLKKDTEIDITYNRIVDEKVFGIDLPDEFFAISQAEKQRLYCEIIYTIKHKIGRTIDGHNDYITDLYRYAQEAFNLSQEEHDRLFALTCEEKPPILFLNVEVMEAKNLEAKDANGFSDPYCMLGIIPGDKVKLFSMSASSSKNNSIDENETQNNRNLIKTESVNTTESHHSHKSSIIKRFSSFRKTDKGKASTVSAQSSNNLIPVGSNQVVNNNTYLNKLGVIRDNLPAKYIKTTDVKKATLNPVWMEKFSFQIDDINADALHLDIWDHDDEFSVFEAARKLNEVKSLKGLDRYFKQIAQSARANKAGNVDDFLGSVNIRLDDLPSSGVDKWCDLEARSERSKVEGKIRLRLKLATKEDRGAHEEDSWNEIKQQEQMLSVFINYELAKQIDRKNREWRGDLCREAETILHQHAIQGDITDFQIALIKWIVFSKKHLEKELSYKLLSEKLDNLDRVWNSSAPSRDEAQSLKESFDSFIKHCFKLIYNLREAFPVTENRAGLEKLDTVLKILNKIYNMSAFKYCFPFQNALNHELLIILKNGTIDWFNRTKAKCFGKTEEENLKKLIHFTHLIYLDLYLEHKYYKSIFESEVKINYFTVAYKKLDSMLMDLVKNFLTEQFGEEIEKSYIESSANIPQATNSTNFTDERSPSPAITDSGWASSIGNRTSPSSELSKDTSSTNAVFNYNTITEQIALSLFELYVSLSAIVTYKKYLSEVDQPALKMTNFHDLFYMPFKKWIELIKHKVDLKVEKCFDSDKNDVLTELTKFSSSSVEVSNCFNQVSQFWKLIDWPDCLGSQIFFNELIECLSKAIIRYANLVKENNQLIITTLTSASNTSLNNAENQQAAKPPKLDAYQKIVITTNNIEKVRESLKAFVNETDYQKLHTMDKGEKGKTLEVNRLLFETCINNTSDYLVQVIEQTMEIIVNTKIMTDIESHMFYLFESPESAPAQESVSRIISYLDVNLKLYKDYAYKQNFERLLRLIWLRLLNEIGENLKKDDTRTQIFFSKMCEVLDLLVNFFNADNQGLPKEYLTSVDKYKELKKYCKLQTIDTSKLIHMYYQEMISVQNSLKTSEYGQLFCRAYYHTKDETLVVEVFKCKNLVPMDPNGLSDPFVEIEVKPSHIFTSEKQITSVVKKSLNPIFNEVFEFKIPEKLCLQSGGVLHFTVMDHDLLSWSNDFEGEGFLELAVLPGVKGDIGEGAYKNLKYTELNLIQPKAYPSKILEVLEYRTQDKLAVEFLKSRRDKLV